MNDAPKQPLQFANRVIRYFADSSLGEERILLPQDYLTIRTLFRTLKGRWEPLIAGDMRYVRLLEEIITAWGALPQNSHDDVESV